MSKNEANNRATSADVAARAGVSQSTVSYVMTGKRSISAETRDRVLAAMKELGFQPNAGARALAGRRSNVIGLVIRLDANTDMQGAMPFIEAVTRRARERDFDVVLVTSDEGAAEMERLARRSVVDAIVLMDIREQDERLPPAAGLGVPVVLIGSPTDNHGLDSFDADFEAAAELAVAELHADGATRVTLIGDPLDVSEAGFAFIRRFEQAVQRSARNAGLSVDVARPSRGTFDAFTDVAPRLLPNPNQPGRLGIVARTPQVVGWTLHYLGEHGYRAGEHVGLVGVCTDAAATRFPAAVTNVSPEPWAVSFAAVDDLLDQVESRHRAQGRATLVAPRITRRSTTRR